METIDFSKLIRYFWVILLGMVLGATAAFLYTGLRSTDYQVQARLLVGPGIDSARPDLNVLRASGQLILTYAELPLTEPFLQELIDELHLEMTPEALGKMISVRPNPETQILTIEVRSQDPNQARQIAYRSAEKLVSLSPSNPESLAAQVKSQLQVQVSELEQSVADAQQSLQQLEVEYQQTLVSESMQKENIVFSEAIFAQLDRFERNTQLIANAASQRQAGVEILEELVANTNGRIVQFEYELQQPSNPITQQIISEQIRLERIHLSNLRQTIAEISTPFEGLPLDEHIAATQQRINELNEGLTRLVTFDLRRLQLDQISQAENRLSVARAIETARMERILAQIAGERERISDVALARIENQRQIQERVTQERTRLTEMQNTLAILYNSADTPDPNQVKIIELASPAPVVPSLSLMVLIGLFTGAFLSTALILGLSAISDAVENSEHVSAYINAPVVDVTTGPTLAGILLNQKPDQKKILEKYQTLGLHLLYGQEENGFKVLAVSPADSHTNSGMVAANLAMSLAQSGKKVLLVDANIDQPTVAAFLQLEQQEGLVDLLADPARIDMPVAASEQFPTLNVLPFGQADPNMVYLNATQLITQLVSLQKQADLLLVSTPSLRRPDSLALAAYTKNALIVVEKGRTSQKILHEAAENLTLVGAEIRAVALASRPFTGIRLPKIPDFKSTDAKMVDTQLTDSSAASTPENQESSDSFNTRAAS